MTLLSPIALALEALAVPVILMYVLKLRRQPMIISSTFLWRRAIDDVQANAPWQRLRISWLLVLQLLALLALVVAQAQPVYSKSVRFNGDLILIVDQSYGMQARDVAPSRFAVALGQARSLADGVPSGAVVSVIGMAAQPALAVGDSSDRGTVARALNGLHDGDSAPNFLEALSLAASLARSGQATRAVVLTSRQSGITGLPIHVPFPVEIVRIGERLHDLGITRFGASRHGGFLQALIRMENFGVSTSKSDLNLFVDGQLADVRPLQVRAGKQTTVFWNDIPAGAHILHARLTTMDDLSADKQAWAVIQADSVKRVLLVTRGDYFLQTALTLDPAISLKVVSPTTRVHGMSRYNLVVFDGILPRNTREVPPDTPVLMISPPAGGMRLAGTRVWLGKFHSAGTVSASATLPPSLFSILQYVDVSDVHVARVRSSTLPGWLEPVFLSGGRPLIAVGQIGNRRVAISTFKLQESDWPLRISFPILIQNLVGYLVPGVGVSVTSISPGQVAKLIPEPGVHELDVTRPDGVVDRIPPPFPPLTDTSIPGIYTVREVGRKGTVRFSDNFMPQRPVAAAGPRRLVVGAVRSGPSKQSSIPLELGWVVILACLGLLTGEWWLAFRR